MSPFAQSSRKGEESGQDTPNEHQRTESLGNHAKAGGETNAAKGSSPHTGSEYPADKTVIEKLSWRWSARLGIETAWATKQQPTVRNNATKGT